jgi:hypothetical protein
VADAAWCWRSLTANIRARLYLATAEAFEDTYVKIVLEGHTLRVAQPDGTWLEVAPPGSEVSAH